MNEKQLIWDTLLAAIKNPFGVAGLMGNLFAESSLNPLCKTGGKEAHKKLDAEAYVSLVDNGTIGQYEFARDGVAFGLVQWCYWSRKEALYIYAKEKGISIGDLSIQLGYLLEELPKYKTVWTTLLNATSIKEASDIVMIRYEQPGDTSDKAKEKRASFGQGYYDQFALKDEPTPGKRYVETTRPDVNLRVGNGKGYPLAGKASLSGSKYEWIATSSNNWHAIVAKNGKRVVWISGDFSKVVEDE